MKIETERYRVLDKQTFHFHELSDNFVGYLISPVVNNGHIYIVNEDSHLLASWRAIRVSHTFINECFYSSLTNFIISMEMLIVSVTKLLKR